jgi:adenine-specific DNA methylase
MIERDFDISFVADLALREKQIQQNYRPIIAVHKWFARRPGTLFRGLLLSEFSKQPLREIFYKPNRLNGIKIADPFMGGGTPILEANRLGCHVIGFDINPMSYWIVKQEIEHVGLNDYMERADSLRGQLEKQIGSLYRTRCTLCGTEDAYVKYFLWVKAIKCRNCHEPIDLFPGYLVAADSRHPRNVFICPACGHLTETAGRKDLGACRRCRAKLSINGPAKRNRCTCKACGTINDFPSGQLGPPIHRLFAIEYYCAPCKAKHVGRFFKTPESQDLDRLKQAEKRLAKIHSEYIPELAIPTGDETNRLHRWGYGYYREMFNARQLLGLELSARIISQLADEKVHNALATNFSDLLRYQNMLCRYDTTALKSLDIFSVHGFPVGLVQCESNFLGIIDHNKNACIGSGGWANIIEKYRKAKAYCDRPFEIRYRDGKKEIVPMRGEWIGERLIKDGVEERRAVEIYCQDAATAKLPPFSLDAVFTDPPYFGNVQYAELMDFCYAWLRGLIESDSLAFSKESTRDPEELTANEDMGRGLEHFTIGLSAVFQRMSYALKPGAPLAFTYHHNRLDAYYPIAVAILDAGFTCSASFPCPAEMGASIHINGTGSSIIDTIFVCRLTGSFPKKWLVDSAQGVADLVKEDLSKLRSGNVKPSLGDIRCITYGHLVRLSIWHLRKTWDRSANINTRISKVAAQLQRFGGWSEVEKHLKELVGSQYDEPLFAVREETMKYGAENGEISF